ncbi:MAG: hypothetical protein IAG13_13935 [Deltaproteobacteria bacterium]|nr:hypothetical protein [Nannocystaceae bacterium]
MPACSSSNNSPTDTSATGDSSSSTTNEPSTTLTTAASEESGTSSTTTDADSSTSLDSTDTGVPGACPEGSLCGTEPPEGWFGPTIIARVAAGETAPECPEEFPDAGPGLFAGFADVEDAECACECEPPAAPNCNAQLLQRGNNCIGYQNFFSPGATCTNTAIDGYAELNIYAGYYYGGADCTASQTAAIPPIGWEATISTCRLSETPLSCQGTKVCIPPPAENFEDTWCIYQQGDLGCPAGVFNTKSVFFTGAEDTRDCSNCNCGTPGSSCGEGQLLGFDTMDCAGEPSVVLEANGSCGEVDITSFAMEYPGSDTCPVTTQPQPIGDAEPTGEFTFCCVG